MIKIIYPKPKCYFAALVLYTIETKVRGIRLAENLSRAPKVLCVYSICAMISETIIYANSEIFDNVLLPILNFFSSYVSKSQTKGTYSIFTALMQIFFRICRFTAD